MTIMLTDTTQVHLIGYAGRDGANVNVLGAVLRDTPDGLWYVSYRVRYIVDDKLDDSSKDHKSWYTVPSRDHADEPASLGRAFRLMLCNATALLGIDETVLVVDGGRDRTLELLATQPWFHSAIGKVN